jgi:cobalt-zinc-cadmium efflux system outer membrane protein
MQSNTRGFLPCIFLIALAGVVPAAGAQSLTLGNAWRIAEQANPALRSARASRFAVEGQLTESELLLRNNPTVLLDPNRRVVSQPGGADVRFSEWRAGVSQTFEIAGQQGLRKDAALQDSASLEFSLKDLLGQLHAEVEERFVRVLALQRRARLERENLVLVDTAAGAMGKRVAAGEASKLEGNLAAVEAERTRNQLGLLEESLIASRAELAQLLQLAAESLPEAEGEIDRRTSYSQEALLESTAKRPQLAALERREMAARSRLELERASVYPDVTVGVNTGREGTYDLRERVVGFSVSVPLPLFRRNQAGIGKAMTDLTQAEVERQTALRDARATVLAQWKRVEQLRERTARLRASVLPPLEENLRLSQSAFRAGEIGLTELLLVNRQVLDGRRDALQAETELRLAQIALERAAGWTL